MAQTKILYIEDNPENRLLVRRTLEASGYALTEAVDGPSGLKAAQGSRPDLILLDISLPEMDGYDLARRFAGFEHLEHVPILAVTANVMKGDKERALESGCDGYIPKPIDIDQLPRQVEEALGCALRRRGETEREPEQVTLGSDADGRADEAQPESVSGVQEGPAPPVPDESVPGARPPASIARRTSVRSDRETLGGTTPADEASRGRGEHRPKPVSRLDSPSRDEAYYSGGLDEAAQLTVEGVGEAVPPGVRAPVEQTSRAEGRGGLAGGGETRDPTPVFRLPEACQALVVEEMESLASELGATAVILARGSQVVAEVAGADGCESEELASLAAKGFRASDSAASLLGCDGDCREQITDTGTVLLHAVAIDDDLVLMAAMPASVPLGAARLWVRRAAGRVDRMVRREV